METSAAHFQVKTPALVLRTFVQELGCRWSFFRQLLRGDQDDFTLLKESFLEPFRELPPQS
jgi:hypothetical protein